MRFDSSRSHMDEVPGSIPGASTIFVAFQIDHLACHSPLSFVRIHELCLTIIVAVAMVGSPALLKIGRNRLGRNLI